MDKYFENWLKQEELYEYYQNNPEQRNSIFEEYQHESAFTDIDSWLEWLYRNPELAEKYYPKLTYAIKDRIRKKPSYFTASIIQKLPEQFNIMKMEVDQLFGKTRQKKIQEFIHLLDGIVNSWQFSTEIEIKAVDDVRDELTEQLKYWENELKTQLFQKKSESEFSILEWATIFYYANETNLLPDSRTIKARMEKFMEKHEINTTFQNFRIKYYDAKKRLNNKNDYPINKLKSLIPFLRENYPQTVTKLENDIIFLESEQADY